MHYLWDKDRLSGVEWAEVLDINGVAWDMYYLYGPDARWEEVPTVPGFWMHQLGIPEEVAPHLDGEKLSTKIGESINSGR